MLSFDSTPALACHVGKVPLPLGVCSDQDQVCALTGATVPAGTANLVKWSPGRGFRDQYDIVDRSSQYVTCATDAILTKPFMQKYSKSVIGPDGWFRFASTNDVAWHLVHPPTPPFVMIFGIAQMEHLLWRTPMSLSRELFFVRLGTRILRIRHSRVTSSLSMADECVAAVNAASLPDNAVKPLRSPFILLSREINLQANAMIHPRVEEAAEAGIEEASAFIALVPRLTSGDLWAIGRILASRAIELTKPKPITLELPNNS